MDPLSITAASVGFVDAAARVAKGCFQLYEFWESLQDAPATVQVIKVELGMLRGLLQPLSSEPDLAVPVVSILRACDSKVQELWEIVADLDLEPFSADAPKQKRLWTKYKMTTKIRQVEKFRKGLSELKSTLTLALMYQNILNPRVCVTHQNVEIVQVHVDAAGGDAKSQLKSPILSTVNKITPEFEPAPTTNTPDTTNPNNPYTKGPKVSESEDTSLVAIASSQVVQSFLQRSLHLAVDEMIASGTIQQLMESTMSKVSSRYDTAHSGSYDDDKYNIQKDPAAKESAAAPPRLTRSKICHQKTSMGVMLGSIWIRTSTLKATEGSTPSKGGLEVITSFIFYPASWLSKLGLRYGTEANLQWSATAGWKFNVSAVRAVPDNALIFDMCREGNIAGVEMLLSRGDASLKDTSPKGWTPLHFAAKSGHVEMLLSRGDASLKDTSPKGWTPLHFAAKSGHVELCSALIKAGADRQALAYEGPTEDALSPLGIWSEFCGATPSKRKIDMIRTFGAECLDVSELNGDGWVVGHNLIKHMSLEECDMAETAVQWVYTQKQTEILVALGANSIWHGLQQAVRGFLVEEHGRSVLRGLLQTGDREIDDKYLSQVSAIGHWLALRASGRDLLPLIVQAAQCLQVDGFDPLPGMDGFGARDLNRSLPVIYTTWAKVSPRVLSNVTALVEAELDTLLSDLSMDRDELARSIQASRDERPKRGEDDATAAHKCLGCGDDYTTLGKGIVQPRRISFDQCRATRHKYHCECAEYLAEKGITPGRPVPESGDIDEQDDSDVEEEFYMEGEVDVDRLCEEFAALKTDDDDSERGVQADPFYEAASMLYRAQGRRWIGTYAPGESLCAACFLRKEQYAGEGGPGDGFTPIPLTYASACPPEILNPTYGT